MPEVVEVKKYADFIKEKLLNKMIVKITVLGGRYKKKGSLKGLASINKVLPLKVIDVKTKGKFLYIILDDEYFIFSTLGLSGGWTYKKKDDTNYIFPLIDKNAIYNKNSEQYINNSLNHLNIEFLIDDGSLLYFYDPLSYGTIKITDDKLELIKKLKQLGPDIMDPNTTFDVFVDRIMNDKNSGKYIGNVLVNQKVISGIGNYLRADILWLSKISPFKIVGSLNENDIKKIYNNAKFLTWGDYNFNKGVQLGYYKKNKKLPCDYGRLFFVYMQDTDINGNEVTKEKLYEGNQIRYIHWVKNVQKN